MFLIVSMAFQALVPYDAGDITVLACDIIHKTAQAGACFIVTMTTKLTHANTSGKWSFTPLFVSLF